MPLLNIYRVLGNNINIQLRIAFLLEETKLDYI